MKHKATRTGTVKLLRGRRGEFEIRDPNKRSLACDTIFDFFPNVDKILELEYRITVRIAKSAGAKSFVFLPRGFDCDHKPIIYWAEIGGAENDARYLYKTFRAMVAETLTKKQKENLSPVVRWITLERI